MTVIWFFGTGLAVAGALLIYAATSAPKPRQRSVAQDRTPGAVVTATDDAPGCAATAKLIPSCGAWWGVAPDVFGGRPPAQAVAAAEERMGRKADILHVYHRGAEPFPTQEERRLARKRILLINWKPSLRHTWAEIADGAIDDRIDRLAARIRRTLPERFFLTVHHEPENDVRAHPGSGMTADDYAAMYRHVVLRLRDHGVRNAVTVMTYMGAPNWAAKPWFERLYPGDDVVDWIGLDPYADRRVSDFAGLVDKTRADHARWPGFYRWTQTRFPGKPIMMAEWGAFERHDEPSFKVLFFNSVRRQIKGYPQIKALVYFDSPRAPRGDTRFDSTVAAGRAFTELARAPYFSSTPVPDH
ncbi:glycoside hydrolase family 26 protein [Sphaerisporangium melleum]|uniref:glycoside hydrolase family 26 protein n=1 Tax=Sphaerisporangium melleum TaxID=321316 RepID=UPI001E601D16|nr:glycosyl hydrolase [Sphaerisporangium melleum]